MTQNFTLLRNLHLKADENGVGSCVQFESFVAFLKTNHHTDDLIVGIKICNVRKEINDHKNGLMQINSMEYISYCSILRYIFHHCD